LLELAEDRRRANFHIWHGILTVGMGFPDTKLSRSSRLAAIEPSMSGQESTNVFLRMFSCLQCERVQRNIIEAR
jgi:hypothetical protein